MHKQQEMHLLIEGSKAQITLEDEWVIPVVIVKALPNEQLYCQDIAGRWRSPLVYKTAELHAIDGSPSIPHYVIPKKQEYKTCKLAMQLVSY